MKRILAFACLVAIAAGCVREEVQEPLESVHTIYARITGDETKVQLNSARKTVWTAEDQIIVLGEYDVYNYSEWTFDGQTGDRDGSFSLTSAGKFNDFNFGDKYHAIYGPYDGLNMIDGRLVLFSKVLAAQTMSPAVMVCRQMSCTAQVMTERTSASATCSVTCVWALLEIRL